MLSIRPRGPRFHPDTDIDLTIDDYFGELSLFVTKKLAYTARTEL